MVQRGISVTVHDPGCAGWMKSQDGFIGKIAPRVSTIVVDASLTLRQVWLRAGLKCTVCDDCPAKDYIGRFFCQGSSTPDFKSSQITTEMFDKPLSELLNPGVKCCHLYKWLFGGPTWWSNRDEEEASLHLKMCAKMMARIYPIRGMTTEGSAEQYEDFLTMRWCHPEA